MKTKRTEVKVFKVEAMCECGGELDYREHERDGYGSFMHKCLSCGELHACNELYPVIEYEEVEDNG